MALYRKRSEPVEARQYVGYNYLKLSQWLGYAYQGVDPGDSSLLIENRCGRVRASVGDFIVKDEGFYPVEPAEFAVIYEAAT